MKLLSGTFALALTLVGSAALAQTTAAPGAGSSAAPMAPAEPATPAAPAVQHLVYRFGYNTKATKEGRGTGTTTIDFVGPAPDGGVLVTATDDWWNAVNPRQTYTCELYPNGGVTCAKPPFALSPIQVAIVPLLGKHYFAGLSGGPTATWTQKYNVRATFFPGASGGFAGQVYTWNSVYHLTGKGPISSGSPQMVVHLKGSMKQNGGRAITANELANVAFDPRSRCRCFSPKS